MFKVRQIQANWSQKRFDQIVSAALEQEIFSYFESSDATTQWIGIGSVSRITPSIAAKRFTEVQDWYKSLISKMPPKTDLDTIAIFGGFSFDNVDSRVALWKDWQNGVFILPRVIIKKTNEQIFVSEIKHHEFSDTSVEGYLDNLILRSKSVGNLSSFEIKDLDPDWANRVDDLVGQIKGSQILKKVVLGRYKFGEINGNIDPQQVVRSLQTLNQTTYHFLLRIKGQLFVSSTPERLFKVDGDSLSTAAIAGTIGRGKTQLEDNRLALQLFSDKKERSEHDIVVQEILQRIKKLSNDVTAPKEPLVLKNQTVQHLLTPIEAKISADDEVFDIVQLMHPTPALGGMPTVDAVKLIEKMESQSRVLFGAPIGYITLSGNAEMIVGIRSMYVYYDQFLMFAGAGIMPDSVGEKEFSETELKFQPMIRLLKFLEVRQ